ncbi:NAD-dependent epimerase/dehydratase family protein [Aeromonas simiae]|uniref:NAD-dependent epimerase/dehydratase family protein n=1 Tax=Aeromonas simiae TaxID=218936 RepID=UPI0005A66679|nr:NAD-dependent epimerase/dehydratase family protein [Aeromonas simiae]MDO2947498.1 NAD-dependent epimerase/dehydratase family protein [Aeromonas simiae]MDO2951590.1 NAD-dependent epimerase/dehydratase family protein [Aeromonas simiae]MDO2955058.1 NAD-dependent epimerase/dehydratase family protein [Aeromonas simiae]
MNYLVTGAAGFIGFHVAARLCAAGHQVVGLDNLNHYYDVNLKRARLARLLALPGFRFVEQDLCNLPAINSLFAEGRFERVIHLAAQGGVRHSLEQPFAYSESNITGMLSVLEGCRHHGVGHLIYASSSSVYGLEGSLPSRADAPAGHPVSLYAASKRAGELMAHSYSHLYAIPTTGLRFFTVYGPWGRPDMALFKFVRAALADEPLDLYNHGELARDFTYIDDIVEGVLRITERPPQGCPTWRGEADASPAPYRLYNIGHGEPVRLETFVEAIEQALGRPVRRRLLPMQPGDVAATWADSAPLLATTGYRPQTGVCEGVKAFVDWYLDYYRV